MIFYARIAATLALLVESAQDQDVPDTFFFLHLCFKFEQDWIIDKGSTPRAPGGVPLGVTLRGLWVHFLPI